MKLKKLFAGIVAVAMMATMGATSVFATETPSVNSGNPLKATDSVTITKTYTIPTGLTAPAETFTFKLAPNGAYNGTGDKKTAITNPTAEKSYDVVFANAVNETKTGTFSILLSDLGISKVGVYNYTLTEQDTKKTPGVTYAPSINMTVTVTNPTDENDKTLDYTVALRDAANKKVEATKAFENKYAAQKLTVSKKVHGNMADLSETFAFKVTLTGDTNRTYPAATVAYNNNNPTLPVGQTNPANIAIDGAEHTIYLSHKGEAVINNLPKGVSYTIEEVASSIDYTVSLDTGSTATLSGKIASGEINTADAVAKFNNTHTGVVDTGVILDNAPYIALLTIVAAGAVVMIIKKRRNYED